jgi:hypothetical protein
MVKRIKAIIDSVIYAGMKPDMNRTQPAGPRRFGALRDRLDRFLNGGSGPSDPFYLSNRTTGQKFRFGAMIATPIVILIACLGIVLANVFDAGNSQHIVEKPTAQIAAELLPNIAKDIRIDTNRDIEIENVHILSNGTTKLIGVAHNNTEHLIRKAELTFELTDKSGSRQGAVNTLLENIAAKSSRAFQFSIPQQTASFALVRNIKVIE